MSQQSNPPRPTILIVDDTPDNLLLFSSLLKERYQVKVATGGATALRIAAAAPSLALILLDVMMPGMDGYETCRQLKANPATAPIPVLFLSAASAADEAIARTLGAAGFLTKPVSPALLLAQVGALLEEGAGAGG